MVNLGEALLKVVMSNQRKMLNRWGQKGTWSGRGAISSLGADGVAPANRRDLTRTATRRKRGKPVAFAGGSPGPLGQRTARPAYGAASKG
jgi:hypothetical protein